METKWGDKIPSLEFGVISQKNLLYFDSDWAQNEDEDVETLEIEFWFRHLPTVNTNESEIIGNGPQENMAVLFHSLKEDIMVGIKKQRIFVSNLNKSNKLLFHKGISCRFLVYLD